MNDQEFFDFVHDQYKDELSFSTQLYQRCGLLVAILLALGGATTALARFDLIGRWEQNPFVVVLHASHLIVLALLAAAAAWLFRAMLPREYPKLKKLDQWHRWREDYRVTLQSFPIEQIESAMATATQRALLTRMIEAQATGAWLNQLRLRCNECCINLIGAALFGLLVQTIVFAIIRGLNT